MPQQLYFGCCKLLMLLWLGTAAAAFANGTTTGKATQAAPYRGMVVSIHPLYIVAKQITQGVETPLRLLPASNHGHHNHLAPRLLSQLATANYILWMGSAHEPQFNQAITKVGNQANSVALLRYLPSKLRKRTLQGQATATPETHTWLDPTYAMGIATLIAHSRSKQYPQFKAQYMANLANFGQQVQQLQHTQRKVVPKPINYIAYNDVLQSLERSANLRFIGAYSKEGTAVSPQQLRFIAEQLQGKHVHCLVLTSASNPLHVGKPINRVIVDPSLGAHQHYPTALAVLTRQLANCASDSL